MPRRSSNPLLALWGGPPGPQPAPLAGSSADQGVRPTNLLINRILRSTATAAMIALPALAQEHQIIQKDRAFSQTEISLKLGESIVFRNADEVTHNVFSVSPGMEFDIRRQAPGGASTVTFSKEGVAEVRCSIHPKMKLVVTVKK